VLDPDAPNGIGVERSTATCCHCQHIIFLKPGSGYSVYLIYEGKGRYREEPGAFCGRCMAPVCLSCHADGRCRPWEQQLEIIESRDRMLRAMGLPVTQ
jgi:hypothetical protein